MIREQLAELYTINQDRFSSVKNTLNAYQLHGPYLSSPGKAYLQQQNPLLIIGQETRGWENYTDINEQMKVYEVFKVGKTYKSSSPFWQIARKLEKALGHEHYSCAALNLNKFDVDRGKPKEIHIGPIRDLDDILISEINIIKPKLCIFFTSHNSDYRLRVIYPELEILPVEGWDLKQLSLLKHSNLPQYTFRTYHPSYLRRKGLEKKFVEFISMLSIF